MTCPNGHDSSSTDYCDTCGEAMPAPGTTPAAPEATPAPASADADATAGSGDQPCPNCALPNPPDALFCENCGYDHTTGTMPRRPDAPDEAGVSDAAQVDSGSPVVTDGPAGMPSAASASALASDGGPAVSAVAVAAGASATSGNSSPELDPPWVAEVWIDPQWYGQQESPDPLPSPGLPDVVTLRHTSLLIGRVSQSRGISPDIDCGADNGVSRRHAQLTTDGQRWWVEDLDSSNGTFLGDAMSPPPSTAIPVGSKREVGENDRIYLGSWTRIVLRPAVEGEF